MEILFFHAYLDIPIFELKIRFLILNLDNGGGSVQVSECPNKHGKIKSPLCCGQDMTCSVG